MRRWLPFLCSLLLLCGCAVVEAPQPNPEGGPALSQSQSEAHSMPKTPPKPLPPKQTPVDPEQEFRLLPQQVKDLIARAREKCEVLYFSPAGKLVKTISLGKGYYTNGSISPDGQHIHAEANAEGGGEAYWCSYVTYNIAENRLNFWNDINSIQYPHKIIDNCMIGHAFYFPFNNSYRPIQFYDMDYQPLELTLDFDFGERKEIGDGYFHRNSITGMAFDGASQQFILTYAIDRTDGAQGTIPFEENYLGIAVFDRTGALLQNVPTQYIAPYSGNTLGLLPNAPEVSEDGVVYISAQKLSGQYRVKVTLRFDPRTSLINEIPHARTTQHGIYSVAMDDRESLRLLKSGEVFAQMSSSFSAEGYHEPFWMQSCVLDNTGGYWIALNPDNFWGIFRFSYDDFRNPVLVTTVPSFANFMGIDEQGNFMIFNGRSVQGY